MRDRVGQHLGHYRLQRRLGVGTFAEVYEAEHVYLKRLVAVKVLHEPQPSDQEIEQFRLEAEHAAELEHPHILRVHDFGFGPNGEPFLVMDLASSTLRELFPMGTAQAPEVILPYLKQIAAALDYAHRHHRMLHRDVKPSNILLSRAGLALMADFGLALVLQKAQTHQTQATFAGTVLYAAPEQIDGYRPCAESDQYAVGVMVYQWLTGEPPFTGNDAVVGAQKLNRPPAPLRSKVASIPALLDQAVLMSLRQNPKDRFRSVGAFARAVETSLTAGQLTVIASGTSPSGAISAASASTQPETLRGRDLVDEEALPAWLKAFDGASSSS